jgi:hypothetical protein
LNQPAEPILKKLVKCARATSGNQAAMFLPNCRLYHERTEMRSSWQHPHGVRASGGRQPAGMAKCGKAIEPLIVGSLSATARRKSVVESTTPQRSPRDV